MSDDTFADIVKQLTDEACEACEDYEAFISNYSVYPPPEMWGTYDKLLRRRSLLNRYIGRCHELSHEVRQEVEQWILDERRRIAKWEDADE